MNSTNNKLNHSDFSYGKSFYFTLDQTKGIFSIENNEHKEVARVENLKGKKLIPFVSLLFTNSKVHLVEQSFEPGK